MLEQYREYRKRHAMPVDRDGAKDSWYLRGQGRLQAIVFACFLVWGEWRGVAVCAVLLLPAVFWLRMYRRFDVIGLPIFVGGLAAFVAHHAVPYGVIGVVLGLAFGVIAWQTRLPRPRKFA